MWSIKLNMLSRFYFQFKEENLIYCVKESVLMTKGKVNICNPPQEMTDLYLRLSVMGVQQETNEKSTLLQTHFLSCKTANKTSRQSWIQKGSFVNIYFSAAHAPTFLPPSSTSPIFSSHPAAPLHPSPIIIHQQCVLPPSPLGVWSSRDSDWSGVGAVVGPPPPSVVMNMRRAALHRFLN